MVTFPLDFPANELNTVICRFNLNRNDASATQNSGDFQVAELAPARWMIEITSKPNDDAEYEAWKAFELLLRGGQNRFLGYNVRRPMPLAYVDSGLPEFLADGVTEFDGTALTEISVSTGFEISIKNLPAEYKFSVGDMIGWKTGNVYSLHKIVEAVDADEDGFATVTFEPRIQVSSAEDNPIYLVKPKCLMAIVKDTFSEEESEITYSAISFKAIQVRA